MPHIPIAFLAFTADQFSVRGIRKGTRSAEQYGPPLTLATEAFRHWTLSFIRRCKLRIFCPCRWRSVYMIRWLNDTRKAHLQQALWHLYNPLISHISSSWTSKLTVTVCRPTLKPAISSSRSVYQKSEFAIINTDNPEDFPIEEQLEVSDTLGITFAVKINYVYGAHDWPDLPQIH